MNAPELCVVSGDPAAVGRLRERLTSEGVDCRPLRVTRGYHSALLDPVLDEFAAHAARVAYAEPQRPYLSNLTGGRVTPGLVTDPAYWVRHLREPVRFAESAAFLAEQDAVVVEVGPGHALGGLARLAGLPPTRAVAAMRHPRAESDDVATLLDAVGRLWLAGVPVDTDRFHGTGTRRVPLPGYPFERHRYWIAPASRTPTDAGACFTERVAIPGAMATLSVHQRAEETGNRPALSSAFVAPEGAGQEAVAAVWSELLGIAPIGAFDDFFELGGHSLLATQVVVRLRARLGVAVPLETVFARPTVAALAAALPATVAAVPTTPPVAVPVDAATAADDEPTAVAPATPPVAGPPDPSVASDAGGGFPGPSRTPARRRSPPANTGCGSWTRRTRRTPTRSAPRCCSTACSTWTRCGPRWPGWCAGTRRCGPCSRSGRTATRCSGCSRPGRWTCRSGPRRPTRTRRRR